MARPPSSLTNLFFLRQNPCSIQSPASSYIRNIGIGSDDGKGFMQNHDIPKTHHHKPKNFTEIAKRSQESFVSRIIRTRPRWENTLLSDLPTVNFLDPNFFREVLKHQNNAFLSLRFFCWVRSQCGFLLDESLCNVIFGGLVEAKAANATKSFIDSTKFTREPGFMESYIQSLCENGLIEETRNVFDQLKRVATYPSLATWNSALFLSIRAGRADVVWKLYDEMMKCGVFADADTIGCLIQAFCTENNYPKGYELLRQVLEAWYIPSNVAFNKLLYGFCKDRYYSRVSELLHTMIAKNGAPDIFIYQQIIPRLCQRRMWPEGFLIFNDLKDRGHTPDRVMYTTMIHGLCKLKWLGDARNLWFEMIKKGIIPSEYTYNTLIYGFFKTGNLEEAHKLYKEMCDKGYKETTMSYNTIISGLCSHRRMKEAHDLFKEMPHKGISHDVITYNVLIQGFCKEGKIAEGVNLFHELLNQGLHPSTASYTSLIEQLCEVGHETLWKDMQDRGVKPAVCTHDFIITGLSKQGYVAEGIEWLATMLSSRIRPQKETFEKLIRCLSKRDKLDAALFVLDYMFKLGYALSECVFNSLVYELCKDNSHQVETCIRNILERR